MNDCSNSMIVINGEAFLFGNCPTCKGLALVLHHEPTEEMQDWAHRQSCRNMIEYLDNEELPRRLHPNRRERRYAFGKGHGNKRMVA